MWVCVGACVYVCLEAQAIRHAHATLIMSPSRRSRLYKHGATPSRLRKLPGANLDHGYGGLPILCVRGTTCIAVVLVQLVHFTSTRTPMTHPSCLGFESITTSLILNIIINVEHCCKHMYIFCASILRLNLKTKL